MDFFCSTVKPILHLDLPLKEGANMQRLSNIG